MSIKDFGSFFGNRSIKPQVSSPVRNSLLQISASFFTLSFCLTKEGLRAGKIPAKRRICLTDQHLDCHG